MEKPKDTPLQLASQENQGHNKEQDLRVNNLEGPDNQKLYPSRSFSIKTAFQCTTALA